MSSALQVLIPTISIVLAIVASHMSLRREIVGVHPDMEAIRERMARLERIMAAILKTSASPRSDAAGALPER